VIDPWLLAVAVLLIVLVPIDWIVAGIWIGLALVKPPITFLTVTAKRHVIYAIVASFAGILGVQSIMFAAYGIRILPVPLPTLLIAAILVGVSIPNFLSLRYLRDVGEREGKL
jgi:hypothetical protein